MIVLNPRLVLVTCLFMVFDILTGTAAAWTRHEINSTKAREGIEHKVGMLLLIAFGVLLDTSQAIVDLGLEVPTCAAICLLIVATEIYSIVENCARMLPDELAAKLVDLFHLSGDKFYYLYDELLDEELEEELEDIPFDDPEEGEDDDDDRLE